MSRCLPPIPQKVEKSPEQPSVLRSPESESGMEHLSPRPLPGVQDPIRSKIWRSSSQKAHEWAYS